MTLTASDVASLSKSLSRSEIGEYICAGLVTIACAGEYVAEFKNWFTGGIRERKERLAKRSTLLLIVALSLELICLVRTNILSEMLIGSLSEKAEEADRKAKMALGNSTTALTQSRTAEDSSSRALDESSTATTSASNALALASGARREADSFERDIVSAKEQAAKAESHLADALQKAATADQEAAALRNRFSDRTLTDGQVKSIADEIRPYSGQEFDVTTFWDLREPFQIANRVAGAMIVGGWKYVKPESTGFLLGGLAGVEVWVHPAAPDGVKKAADALILALNKEGIAAHKKEQNPKNPIDLKIHLNVGTKE